MRPFPEDPGRLGLRLSCLTGLFVAILGFWTGSQDQFELPKLSALALCLGAGGIFLLLSDGRRGKPLPLAPLLFALALLPSLLLSESFSTSFWGDYENFAGFWTWSSLVLLALLWSQAGGPGESRPFSGALIASSVLASAYALLQRFGIDFVGWNPSTLEKSRSFGSLGNPNFLGGLAAMALVPSLDWIRAPRGGRRRLAGLISAPVLALGLLATGSRAALAAGLAGSFVWLICFRRARRVPALGRGAFLLLILFLAASLANSRSREALGHPLRELGRGRLHIWAPALTMSLEKPASGLGLDCFKIAFPRFQGANFGLRDGDLVSSRTAHNEILQFSSTAGLPGLAAYLGLLAWAWFRSSGSPRGRALRRGILSAYAVQAFFGFGVAGTLAPLFLCLVEESPGGEAPGPGPRSALGMAGLALAFTGALRFRADLDFARGMRLLFRPGMEAAACRAMDEAAGHFPWEAKYRVYQGSAYEGQALALAGEPARTAELISENSYREALNLAPLNPYYVNNLGRILEMKAGLEGGDPGSAESNYRRATEMAPQVAFFQANLGLFLESRGQFQESELRLRRCLALSPQLGRQSFARALDLARKNGDGARARFWQSLLAEAGV